MHPKNSKTSRGPQDPHTAEQGFEDFSKGLGFAVRAGIPMVDALDMSSCRLAEALQFIREHMDEDTGLAASAVWLLQSCISSAKALVDASSAGLSCRPAINEERAQ